MTVESEDRGRTEVEWGDVMLWGFCTNFWLTVWCPFSMDYSRLVASGIGADFDWEDAELECRLCPYSHSSPENFISPLFTANCCHIRRRTEWETKERVLFADGGNVVQSVAGISFKSQFLYLVVYVSRYLGAFRNLPLIPFLFECRSCMYTLPHPGVTLAETAFLCYL